MTKSQKLRADTLAGKVNYLHVSVLVGTAKDSETGVVVHTRTPKGKGGTARKNKDVEKIIRQGRHRRELRRQARSAD